MITALTYVMDAVHGPDCPYMGPDKVRRITPPQTVIDAMHY